MIDQARIAVFRAAADLLAAHNRWRRGEDDAEIPAPFQPGDATKLGEAIDTVVAGIALLLEDNAYAWSRFDRMVAECARVERHLGMVIDHERAKCAHYERTLHAHLDAAIKRLSGPTIFMFKETTTALKPLEVGRVLDHTEQISISRNDNKQIWVQTADPAETETTTSTQAQAGQTTTTAPPAHLDTTHGGEASTTDGIQSPILPDA